MTKILHVSVIPNVGGNSLLLPLCLKEEGPCQGIMAFGLKGGGEMEGKEDKQMEGHVQHTSRDSL